jgi:hypothetical protein
MKTYFLGDPHWDHERIFVSHYPHAYWPRSHKGCLHVYGHVHAEREATLDAALPGRRSPVDGLWGR